MGCGCQDKKRMQEALKIRRDAAIKKRNKEFRDNKLITKEDVKTT